MTGVTPIRMPKWGLSMQEGAIVDWWKAEGDTIAEGDDLVDIETSKITNVCESPAAGVLRRIVAQPGETLPVGALIGVLAEPAVAEAEIDTFIADFQAQFTPAEADGEGDQLMRISTIPLGARSIRIGQAGPDDGVPVVLIHGYSGDLNNWLFNVEALAAHYPVVAIDLPGHGGSTKDVGDGSLRFLAQAVADLLAALQAKEVHLVGHSLGAAVAARLAADRPGLAKSLTLIAPAGLSATGVSEPFLTGVVEALRARDLKPVLEMLFADPSVVSKDMVDDVLKFKRLDGVEEALTALRDRLVDGADARALRADLSSIPAAVVVSTKGDQIVGPVDPNLLPPSFRLVWVEDAGHMPHLEKAAEVNALLLEAMG